jgi:hypothetical protein
VLILAFESSEILPHSVSNAVGDVAALRGDIALVGRAVRDVAGRCALAAAPARVHARGVSTITLAPVASVIK